MPAACASTVDSGSPVLSLSPLPPPLPPVLQEPEAPAAAAGEEKEAPKGIPSLGKPKKKEEGK